MINRVLTLIALCLMLGACGTPLQSSHGSFRADLNGDSYKGLMKDFLNRVADTQLQGACPDSGLEEASRTAKKTSRPGDYKKFVRADPRERVKLRQKYDCNRNGRKRW